MANYEKWWSERALWSRKLIQKMLNKCRRGIQIRLKWRAIDSDCVSKAGNRLTIIEDSETTGQNRGMGAGE